MDSSNCGKVCLITCLTCAALIVLFVLLVTIMTCAGCACMSSGLFGGMFSSIGNIIKIQAHFEDLRSQGWEVDDSQSNQGGGYGGNVEAGTPMIWRARENPDDEWIVYVWEFGPADPEAFENLEDEEMPDWSALMNWTLLPRTEAALEVHEELNLPLPDDFELIPWDEDDGGDRDRDRDRDRDEDEVRDRGDDEGQDGEEEGGDGDEEDRPRRSKSFRKAA